MYYGSCTLCNYSFSLTGSVYVHTDEGNIVCESCIPDTYSVETETTGDYITYYVSNGFSLELHEHLVDSIKRQLAKQNIPYRSKSCSDDNVDVFSIRKEDVVIAELAGTQVAKIFDFY